ncbi:hypothetical protein [Rubrivirga sp.]|uniref:hypothetical protein n=1 Tax=Rubrivirga sp. TaxID=1885344 RepID=UPI003B5262A8
MSVEPNKKFSDNKIIRFEISKCIQGLKQMIDLLEESLLNESIDLNKSFAIIKDANIHYINACSGMMYNIKIDPTGAKIRKLNRKKNELEHGISYCHEEIRKINRRRTDDWEINSRIDQSIGSWQTYIEDQREQLDRIKEELLILEKDK